MRSYKRVLLKVSGEALMGDRGFGIDLSVVERIADDIVSAWSSGFEIAVVVGGGNIVRGASVADCLEQRVSGDHMGMLATVINALAFRNAFDRKKVRSVVFSAISMPQICESFKQLKVLKSLSENKIVIFAAGTGNPFFTTDTAATLRAAEIGADVLIKATQVDGIYDSDPRQNPEAKHISSITYDEVLQKNLSVMDMTAISLAKDNNIPVMIYSLAESGNLLKVLRGEGKFSLVT